MARPDDEATDSGDLVEASESSWRDRALERSLRAARAKAISRSDRFIQTAMELLEETGRSDFTVQELVDRSRTSLRSFYQYFAGKDELMVAILEERMAQSCAMLRAETADTDALAGLHAVVRHVYGGSKHETSLMRAMATHHMGLVQTHMADYQRALVPLGRLIRDLVERGVDEGQLRADIPIDSFVVIVFQTILGAAQMNVFAGTGDDLGRHAEGFWEFCRLGLVGESAAVEATPSVREKASRR